MSKAHGMSDTAMSATPSMISATQGVSAQEVSTRGVSAQAVPAQVASQFLSVDGPNRRVFVDIVALADFDLHDLSVVADVLKLANLLQTDFSFDFRLVGITSAPVRASNGLTVMPTVSSDMIVTTQNILLLGKAPLDSKQYRSLQQQLKRRHQAGATIIAIGEACRALASLGLLTNRQCASHWQESAQLKSDFPETKFHTRLYGLDHRFVTCIGGGATLALLLACIDQICGAGIARAIADRFNCERIRDEFEQIHPDENVKNSHMQQAMSLMAKSTDGRLSSAEIAGKIGVTVRQLQRLFRRHVDMTPLEFLALKRLSHARGLLLSTHLSVTEVAQAVGFSSPSHFSRCYREKFSRRPSDDHFGRIGSEVQDQGVRHQG
jgi:transcriptional regulator GlxA family with amidase domain